ncbi:MCE family protein [Nocardioides sp.]|uniref:MCE family protein n=1 Tax=Nocardioides sp. TaxID=35761 RepID=UPI002733D78E|nr:MlaD family protein [Nocardioides sp.]MDP3890311.1 MlaD family protein [Nocardioides sp.]
MTRGIQIRIAAFLVLSAIGIVYVTSSYLGVVDRVLGRGYTVQVVLPKSGGLFVGSEVTYRGVKVGAVKRMTASEAGATLDVRLEEGTRIPVGSPVFVHNLSAVGEQYLDFQPASNKGPYLGAGDTVDGGDSALPVAEADLLVALDEFVSSVDEDNLGVVIEELGDMFRDTGGPLQRLLDGGTTFIDEAAANEAATSALLENALTVLQTQKDQGANITAFSRDLRLLTASLRKSDRNLRRTLRDTPAAVAEVDKMLQDLEPTLPVLLGNLVTVNQVVMAHLAGIEQLLVTFPAAIATGFTGTTPDGFGHVNLQFAQDPPPCREGYMPASEWRRGDQLDDTAIFPAECLSGPPFNMRGAKYAPAPDGVASSGRAYRGTYDPVTGEVEGAVDAHGNPMRFGDQGDLSILGGDAWKWLLVGPVTGR